MTTTPARPTTAETIALAALAPTTDIPTASRALGFGSNLGYELAGRGAFPCRVLKVGRKLRVPTADLLVALGIDANTSTRPALDAVPATSA